MAVNEDWQLRCTAENDERYQGADEEPTEGEEELELLIETNLVFNNPVVAIEIGLFVVVRFLIEKRNIDVNAGLWHGFNSIRQGAKEHLVELALFRGDVSMPECILSVDGFDLSAMINFLGQSQEWLTLCCCYEYYITQECYELFIHHPKVNLNVAGEWTSPFLSLCDFLVYGDVDYSNIPLYIWSSRFQTMLDAGADPYLETLVHGRSPVSSTNGDLLCQGRAMNPIRSEVFQNIQAWERQ